MRGCFGVCAAVLLGTAPGCGGGEGAVDGAPNDGGEVVCAGDRWGGSAEMLGTIVGCTVITGNVSVTGNQLSSVELPLLNRIEGFLTVWGNPVLTRVTLPKLTRVGGYLDVSSNVALISLDLPALRTINERAVPAAYDLVIRDNALAACQADAIRDRLLASGFRGTVSISDNRGSCPP